MFSPNDAKFMINAVCTICGVVLLAAQPVSNIWIALLFLKLPDLIWYIGGLLGREDRRLVRAYIMKHLMEASLEDADEAKVNDFFYDVESKANSYFNWMDYDVIRKESRQLKAKLVKGLLMENGADITKRTYATEVVAKRQISGYGSGNDWEY